MTQTLLNWLVVVLLGAGALLVALMRKSLETAVSKTAENAIRPGPPQVTGGPVGVKASGLSDRPSNVSSQDVLYRVAGVPGGLKTPG